MADIGTTGLRVTKLGLGGVGLASAVTALGGVGMPGTTPDMPYPETLEAEAVGIVRRSLELGVRYFDTAPQYGRGLSERRLGSALSGRERSSFVVSTKVGRVLEPVAPERVGSISGPGPQDLEAVFDFSREGVLRSIDDSLRHLRLDRFDILLIHTPDNHYDQAMEGAYKVLDELRSRGVVRAIGVGIDHWELLPRFAREGDFDCFLVAGRYTLLDHSALPELLPLCQEKNIGMIIGGPYNSGILASNLSGEPTFDYAPAAPGMIVKARRCKAVCGRHGVPLKAVALQFVLAHPAVVSVIPGARTVAEAEENYRMVEYAIPTDVWEELRSEGLIPPEAPTPV